MTELRDSYGSVFPATFVPIPPVIGSCSVTTPITWPGPGGRPPAAAPGTSCAG